MNADRLTGAKIENTTLHSFQFSSQMFVKTELKNSGCGIDLILGSGMIKQISDIDAL